MNEKIRELAEQAKQYAEDEQNNPLKIYTLDCFNEKFAELIVQECIDYCGENLSKTVGGALKIHFGVEE